LSLKQRTNRALADRRRSALRRKATAEIDAILRAETPPGSSDTLSATLAAAAKFESGDGPKTLVICGDGHQVSPKLNVYRRAPSLRRCDEYRRRVAPLPDLRGVAVVFGAATLDGKTALTAEHEQAIAQWWKDCWAPAVHAHVRYGSTPQL
jgi:hypothetical protein